MYLFMKSILSCTFPLNDCLILSSCGYYVLIVWCEFYISDVTWMSFSFYALWVGDDAWILEKPYLPVIIPTGKQFHSFSTVLLIGTIDSIDVSTVHVGLENSLNWET